MADDPRSVDLLRGKAASFLCLWIVLYRSGALYGQILGQAGCGGLDTSDFQRDESGQQRLGSS